MFIDDYRWPKYILDLKYINIFFHSSFIKIGKPWVCFTHTYKTTWILICQKMSFLLQIPLADLLDFWDKYTCSTMTKPRVIYFHSDVFSPEHSTDLRSFSLSRHAFFHFSKKININFLQPFCNLGCPFYFVSIVGILFVLLLEADKNFKKYCISVWLSNLKLLLHRNK